MPVSNVAHRSHLGMQNHSYGDGNDLSDFEDEEDEIAVVDVL